MEQMASIMIVDDEVINIEILLEALESNYDIIVAINGEEALELIQSEKPDLILLDIMMPGIDGYEVCRRIKSNDKTRDIPVVFLSAKQAENAKQKGLELGADDYITKPFDPFVVQSIVEKYLKT
jgi:CheY-like chemotaxis protein